MKTFIIVLVTLQVSMHTKVCLLKYLTELIKNRFLIEASED